MKDDLKLLSEIPDPFSSSAVAPAVHIPRATLSSSPDRSQWRALRLLATAGALLWNGAWVVGLERRPDLFSVSPSRLGVGLAIPLVTGALALRAGAQRGEVGLGPTKARLVALTMVGLAWFTAATAIVAPSEPPDMLFWRHVAGCLVVTAALTAGPLLFGLAVFRRAFVAAPAWRAGALGIASGALAVATMALVCPIGSAWHTLLGHGVLMVIAGAGAALVGRRVCGA